MISKESTVLDRPSLTVKVLFVSEDLCSKFNTLSVVS